MFSKEVHIFQSWNSKSHWLKVTKMCVTYCKWKDVWRLNQVELTQTKEEIRWSKIFFCTLLKNPKVIKPDLCHSWKDGAPTFMFHTQNIILAINGMCRIKWNNTKISPKKCRNYVYFFNICLHICVFAFMSGREELERGS